MDRSMIKSVRLAFLLALVLAARAHAQSEAGTCAAIQGTVDVRHGTWQSAGVGTAVFVGDDVRTAAHSRATIVFRDDSVVELAPDTEFRLESQQFDESARRYQSLLQLAGGKLRLWVSAYYRQPRARYEVETPTAVIGVRGTEFIVSYDGAAETTDVICLEEEVEVSAKLAVMGGAVQLGPQSYTQVRKGKFPNAPQAVDGAHLQRYLDGVDLVGTGRRDGLNVLHPAVVGRVLMPQDVPGSGAVAAASPERQIEKEVAVLRLGAPEGSLGDTLSPDVYTNTQPLIEFRRVPAGQLSSGGVHVEF
jgi:hypothetical protein